MNALLVSCVVLWVLTALMQKLSILTVGSLVSTCLFCSRKIGHFCRLNTILAVEGISVFLNIAWQSLFKSISWPQTIICILLRLIFIGICYYDIKNYVYVKEVHRKE